MWSVFVIEICYQKLKANIRLINEIVISQRTVCMVLWQPPPPVCGHNDDLRDVTEPTDCISKITVTEEVKYCIDSRCIVFAGLPSLKSDKSTYVHLLLELNTSYLK